MPNVNRTYKGDTKSYVQSVRFKKDNWTKSEAEKWLSDNDFYSDGFDDQENEYRFRQYDPEASKWHYLTKESGKTGLYFIIGFRK